MGSSLNIKFVSQNSDEVPAEWHDKACGIACVKMILNFAGAEFSIKDLINEGLEINGYTEYGWDHESLVRLLRNHGVNSYRQEFRSNDKDIESRLRDDGVSKIKSHIDNGQPVIVSVDKGFGNNNHLHLILVTGYDDENFIYNDPDSRNGEEKEGATVSEEEFLKYWRGLAIFVEVV
jgi:uncharacterized protein YvpB